VSALRSILLRVIRLSGGFALARRLTRKQLRILCYHGFSIGDEYLIAPYVFMRSETFERRMRILRKWRLPVLSLSEAVDKLRAGAIASAETVITFDDGWASNLTIGAPILRKYGYPACIYITTDHLNGGTEAFNMALAQMVHESPKSALTLRNIHPLLDGEYRLEEDPAAAASLLVTAAARIGSVAERQRLLAPLAEALGIDYAGFMKGGRFQLLDRTQIRALADLGVSIEMHTHTHTLPDDTFEAMAHEILQNRDAIKELLGIEPRHFCYPSGKYTARHFDWLARLGISSATTCDPGFNGPGTPPLRLHRYLDNELTSDIEFEAEVVGVRELLRRTRAAISALRS